MSNPVEDDAPAEVMATVAALLLNAFPDTPGMNEIGDDLRDQAVYQVAAMLCTRMATEHHHDPLGRVADQVACELRNRISEPVVIVSDEAFRTAGQARSGR